MNHIVSWEAHRLMVLTLLTLLPFLTAETIEQSFSDIARLTLHRLEEDLFLKLSNEKALKIRGNLQENYDRKIQFAMLEVRSECYQNRKHDQNCEKASISIKIRMNESLSLRWKDMKREDWLLEFDQIDIFMQKVKELL